MAVGELGLVKKLEEPMLRGSTAIQVLANYALFNAICVGILFKTVFFGQLRAIEYEASPIPYSWETRDRSDLMYAVAPLREVMAVPHGIAARSHHLPVSLM